MLYEAVTQLTSPGMTLLSTRQILQIEKRYLPEASCGIFSTYVIRNSTPGPKTSVQPVWRAAIGVESLFRFRSCPSRRVTLARRSPGFRCSVSGDVRNVAGWSRIS
jgi:hypothetical protein